MLLLTPRCLSSSEGRCDGRAYLDSHVIIGSSIEVVVRPLSEGVLTKLVCGAMIIERELSVGLEELRLLHLLACCLINNC